MRYYKLISIKIIINIILVLCSVAFLYPIFFTITNSFMSEVEIFENYRFAIPGMAISDNNSQMDFINMKLIPDKVTFIQYYTVLLLNTRYLFMFWNSIKIVIPIVLGQLIVSSMAAYAFNTFHFRGKECLFFTYIFVMLLPFLVTLVPNYIIAEKLKLTGNYLSIILPGIFSPFGVFLLRQNSIYIPNAYVEAAVVDGANHLQIFLRIVLPMLKNGLASLAILVFIDSWNMVEQPLIFLKDEIKEPLSIYLSRINQSEIGIAFAASSFYMIPMLLIFLYGENYIVEGIQLSGIKA